MNFELLENVSDACLIYGTGDQVIFYNQAFLFLAEMKERDFKKIKHFSNIITFSEFPPDDLAIETEFEFYNSIKGFGLISKIKIADEQTMLVIKNLSIEKNLHSKYQNQVLQLKALNVHLEDLVNLRTQQLLRSNNYLSGILVSFEQAIFTVEESGEIDLKNALNIGVLGGSSPSHLAEIFSEKMSLEETAEWLRLLYGQALSFEDMVMVAPDEINYLGSPFRVTYYPFYGENARMQSLIVAITNIAQEVRIRSELSSRELIAANLFKASKNGNRFNGALEECRSLFNDLLNDESQFDQVLRDLHSLKGLLSYYGPVGLDIKVHEIEISNKSLQSMKEMVSELKSDFEDAISKTQALLPHLRNDNKVVSQVILNNLNNAANTQEVKSILLPFTSLDLEGFCASFKDYLSEILFNVQKELNAISINCPSIYLDLEIFPLINQFLIHGLRNSVAHVFTEEVVPGLYENEIHISSRLNVGFLQLDIETRGVLDEIDRERVKSKTTLSGQKKGIELIEQLANKFGCQIFLTLSHELNRSHFSISIPLKYVRGVSHVEV